MRNPCAEGQGDPRRAGVVMATGTGVTQAGDDVLVGASKKYTVVDALHFSFGSTVTAIDLDLNVKDHFGDARDIFTVHEGGTAITDLAAVLDWVDPNPPTNTVRGIMKLGCVALEPTELAADHKIRIIGNDASAAANYTETNSIPLMVTAQYRLIEAEWFE